MSLRGSKGVGIPTVLMHEGEGLVVSVETKGGHTHRGILEVTQDNMNTSLKEVSSTNREGHVTRLERVYIRGSQIVFVVFPDMLRHAPMFRRLTLASQGKVVAGGLGRGRQAAITAKGAWVRVDAQPHLARTAPSAWLRAVAKQQADAAKELAAKARQGGGPQPGGRGTGPPPGFGGPLMPMPPQMPGGPYAGPPSGMMGPPPMAMMGGPLPPGGRGADMTRPAWMQ